MKRRRTIFPLLCALALATPAHAQRRAAPSGVSEIDAYCAAVDAHVKQAAASGVSFARDERARRNVWKRVRGAAGRRALEEGDFNESARVWSRSGRVVAAAFTLQSGSRDWAHFVSYCFRADGTLARIDSRLNTFYGHVAALRERHYAPGGRLLRATEQFYRLGTEERVDPRADTADSFVDEPITLYRSVRELPFYHLLK